MTRGRRYSFNAIKPGAAGEILAGALKQTRLQKKVKQYSLFPLWEDVVGAEVAGVAVPEKITRGKVLVVRVVDASWAQELTMKKIELLDQINSRNTGALLEDVRFVTGNPKTMINRKKK